MQQNDATPSKSDSEISVTDNRNLPFTPTPAARRALAEAAARRIKAEQRRPVEIDGRDGLDPVRYGDWEVKGLASDF